MFWITKGSDTKIDPLNKFKFYAIFDTFLKSDNNLLVFGEAEQPLDIHIAVKKIDAPKINLDFERVFANEQVHYFQNGSIHWEPINISFIDVSDMFGGFSTLRKTLSTYIKNFTSETNRTNVIDLPVLCNEIKIISLGARPTSNYPILNNGKVVQTGRVDDRAGALETKFAQELNQVKNIFIIKKPRLTKIDFGNFDYSSDEINEINITIVPEWCGIDTSL